MLCPETTSSKALYCGLSSVFVSVREVCEAIVDILLPRYINVPSGDRLCDVVASGDFLNVLVPLMANTSQLCHLWRMLWIISTEKGHHSVVMPALVSCDYTFMDIYSGWPGSVHDGRVLTNSKLFQAAEAGTLLPNTTKSINGIDVPLLILGDPASPMLPWLMKPYTDNGRLTAKQLRFTSR